MISKYATGLPTTGVLPRRVAGATDCLLSPRGRTAAAPLDSATTRISDSAGERLERVEDTRVADRAVTEDLVAGHALEQALDGDLELLAREVVGDPGHGDDVVGDVTRGEAGA